MFAMFALFTIELWLHSSGNSHSHGGATGKPVNATRKPRVGPIGERPVLKRVGSTGSFGTIETFIGKEPEEHMYVYPP